MVEACGIDPSDDAEEALHRIAQGAASPLIDSNTQTLDGRGIWEPVVPAPETVIWADLRPSEAQRLQILVREAIQHATERRMTLIEDELTAAGAAFAREFPDVRRHRR
jgi:hypothetical protein